MRASLETLHDIKNLVDRFYEKIRKDDILADLFNQRIQDRWPEHLEKMYRFWQTILLHEYTYHGSPFLPHANLPVDERHFERWLQLFRNTVDEQFSGSKATEVKWRAEKMAEMFQSKIAYHKKNSITRIA